MALLSGLTEFKWLLGDIDYDADRFREKLLDKVRTCITGQKHRKKPVETKRLR